MTSSTRTYFEDVYKSAYSHGLEAIYALENVDLKTVRRISEDRREAPVKIPVDPSYHTEPLSNQLELDFGEEYRGWIDSFALDEPIQVLNLSRLAEKCLCENGKTHLRHIHGVNLREFVFFKGMGQGHLDEIQQKVAAYLSEHTLERCRFVDFASWVRTLTGALNRKKIFVCLETFQLSDSLTLSPSESVEVRRLTLEKRQEWIEEILVELRESSQTKQVQLGIEKMVNVFVKPWLRRRLGFATEQEIMERINNTGREPSIAPLVLNFFRHVYFGGEFPLQKHFFVSGETLFFADREVYQDYSLVVNKAITYFYKPGICYMLAELAQYLVREFAQRWKGFPEGFVEKALRFSPCFSVRKGCNHQLMVKLAKGFTIQNHHRAHREHREG